MISPSDHDLIAGMVRAPPIHRHAGDFANRRRLYLDHLIPLRTALQQRNKLLRDHVIADSGALHGRGTGNEPFGSLHNPRTPNPGVAELTEIFTAFYSRIASDGEIPPCHYAATWPTIPIPPILLDLETRRRDEIVGHTSVGPHRDDIDLQLNGMPVRACSIARSVQDICDSPAPCPIYEFLARATKMKPLLLLGDDISNRLDATRVARLI